LSTLSSLMPDLAIDTTHLARRYGRRWAISDISLQIPAGSVTMVAGRNGSGKSTLFRILSTAIRPDHGAGTILGFDLLRHREDIRRSMALLAHANYLYESLTAKENLEVAADHLGCSRSAVSSLLERVALAPRADDPVSTFSAGMRKRVSFARVLLQEPRLVFLDEPYAQLDPAGFDLVDSVVSELKASGVTVLIATHQLERTAALCDLALHLSDGRVESFGPVRGRG
jgi:heme exporter protein A